MKAWHAAALGGGVVVVGVALVLLRGIFVAPYRVPSAGMYPTHAPGSHIDVNRADRTPARGAIMIFRYPENPKQQLDQRVVALPGDVVQTRGAALTIDGWEVPRCEVGKHSYVDGDSVPPTHTGTLAVEWLGDQTYLVFHDEGVVANDFGPYTVEPGEYFVMGDNRENSYDSRMWRAGTGGGVPSAAVVGRVRDRKLTLPRGAEALRAALDACIAKKPARTTP